MDSAYIEHDRRERNAFLASHYASPLPEEDMADFGGLTYFPPDPTWRLTGRFRSQTPHKVEVQSSAGTASPYTCLGTVRLTIRGASYDLVVLDDGDGDPFIPFRDETSGIESYEGGRYVGVEVDADDEATVDFNLARNPWCVYDAEFVCPLPPAGNTIHTRVTAGEQMYTRG